MWWVQFGLGLCLAPVGFFLVILWYPHCDWQLENSDAVDSEAFVPEWGLAAEAHPWRLACGPAKPSFFTGEAICSTSVKVSWASLFCRSINQYLHMSIWTATGVCIPCANMDHNWYSLCPRYEWSWGFWWSWALVLRRRPEVWEWSQRGN